MITVSPSTRLALALLLCVALRSYAGIPVAPAQPSPTVTFGGEYKSSHLYTSPEPSAGGGLHLISPVPLEFAAAIPENNQFHVYKATIGDDKKEVTFSNIPIARYDLVLATRDHFYVGVSLNRDENSLSPQDLNAMQDIFSRTVPFFDVKRMDIVKGTPGEKGQAAALVQWMRIKAGQADQAGGGLLNQAGIYMIGHEIRSLRLAFLADVGAGWQVTGTREILRTDVFPDMVKGFLGVTYVDALNAVRVVDTVKDIGTVDLSSGTVVSPAIPSP